MLTKPVELSRIKVMVEKRLPDAAEALPEVCAATSAELPTKSDSPPAIDLRLLRETVGNNEEMARGLLNKICLKLPLQIEELAACLKGDDLTALQNAGHKLRGASGMIGATPLAEVCGAIETAAHNGEITSLPVLRENFAIEAERVNVALAALQI